MKLHEDSALFSDAVSITAQQMSLPQIYVEKDYWVTLALHRIFTGPLADFTIFKGGTALSKGFSFIERFSEDIDLVLLKEPSLSANQLKERLKRISQTVAEWLPELEMTGITNKKGMIRKTAHAYSKVFDGEFGQVRDLIIVESSWLGSAEPTVNRQVSSFIYQMIQARGQQALARRYDLLPFDVLMLAPTRTLCEKIMSLVRFSHTETPIRDLRHKIRHIYDLHQLLSQAEIADFFDSDAFDAMLHRVGMDDEISFKNNRDWLSIHPHQALIFADIDQIWPDLRSAYNGAFKNLVFGALPADDLVLQTLKRIKDRLAGLAWTIGS